ncbi:MAG: hypothetical protein ACI4C3_11150 [Bacteroides sp.]
MAIDNKNIALNLEQVQSVTKFLEPDILESASLVNDSVFEELKINVIRDLENVSSLLVFDRKVGTTRRYQAGKLVQNKVGYMYERELKVTLSMNRFTENIQNFREKQPFSTMGFNESGSCPAPISEMLIRQIAIEYSGDVLSNLFFGDTSLGYDNPFALYDGYYKHIADAINRGEISKEKGNYQELDPIDGSDPESDYDTFVKFYQGLDPKLKRAETIYIMCSFNTRQRIIQGYLKKYTGMQTPDAGKPGFRFIDAPKAELVSHTALGEGDCLIATTAYNFDFGSDMRGAGVGNAFVQVDKDQNDFNLIIFQVQTAQGVRIRRVSSDQFCVSSGKNKPFEATGGEYTRDVLTASSNDESMGKVTISPEQESYETGDKVTMTAAAESGYKFVKWSDGATINPRTIVYSGNPESYQAIFETNG